MQRPGKRRVLDWPALKQEWQLSGMDFSAFLQSKNINPWSGNVRMKTKDWFDAVPCGNMPEAEMKKATYPSVFHAIKEEAAREDPVTVSELWILYNKWRQRQCGSDYNTAEKIRQHLRILLDAGLTPGTDAQGNPIMGTTFTPSDLARLTNVAEGVQRIQRLSLGMSTENVGVDRPEESVNVEKSTDADAPQLPVYVVEMSRGGKFVRARPRLATLAAVATEVVEG
jgi:hypothetical protein